MHALSNLAKSVRQSIRAAQAVRKHAETVNATCIDSATAQTLSELLKLEPDAKKIASALLSRASALPVGGFLVTADGPKPARAVFADKLEECRAALAKLESLIVVLTAANMPTDDEQKRFDALAKRADGLRIRISAEPAPATDAAPAPATETATATETAPAKRKRAA